MKKKNTRHGMNEKARHHMRRAGYKVGGAVVSTPAPAPAPEPKKLKTGGAVVGSTPSPRLDKRARGGALHGKKPKAKPHVTVNVLNHSTPPAGPSGPMGMPMPPHPVGPGPGPANMGPSPGPRPPSPMPGAPPGGGQMPPIPMGGPQAIGLKRGGRTKMANGGAPTQGYSTGKIPGPSEEKHLKSGGRLSGRAAPPMDDGAGSGEGRIEKIKAYGTKPKAK